MNNNLHTVNALKLISNEYERAQSLHGDFHSLHEGFAALLEEHDELWDLLKKKRPDLDEVIDEAIQVATMGYKIAIHAMRMKDSKT
jgi:hypothetical protein